MPKWGKDSLVFANTGIYLLDHSEIVEGEGHGFSHSYKGEFEVPLVIWCKEQTKISHLFSETRGKIIDTE